MCKWEVTGVHLDSRIPGLIPITVHQEAEGSYVLAFRILFLLLVVIPNRVGILQNRKSPAEHCVYRCTDVNS